MAPLLGAVRGRPAADLDALVDVVLRVCALLEREDVMSVELNPVFVGPAGAGSLAQVPSGLG